MAARRRRRKRYVEGLLEGVEVLGVWVRVCRGVLVLVDWRAGFMAGFTAAMDILVRWWVLGVVVCEACGSVVDVIVTRYSRWECQGGG